MGIKRNSKTWILVSIIILGRSFLIGPIRDKISTLLIVNNIKLPEDIVIIYIAFFSGVLIFLNRLSNKKMILSRESYYLLASILLCFLLIIFNTNNFLGLGLSVTILVITCILWYFSLYKWEKIKSIYFICYVFFIYLIINILVWRLFLIQKLPINEGVNFPRMGGTLAYTVQLGPIITIICAVYFALPTKGKISNIIIDIVVLILSFISIYLTASRTGFIMFIILCLLILVKRADRYLRLKKVIVFISFISILFLYNNLIKESRIIKLNISNESRIISWKNNLSSLKKFDLNDILFGKGWGNYYPYWEWKFMGGPTWGGRNMFFEDNLLLLVSPHNSFLWILTEGGLIVFILLTYVLMFPIIKQIKLKKIKNKDIILYSQLCILVSFFVDDDLINAPGAAMLKIIISYFLIDLSNYKKMYINET